MRKPRDIDAELKALRQRSRQLQQRKVEQLGELVIACRADALPAELLAGALIAAVGTRDAGVKEGWRARGAAFFQRKARSSLGGAAGHGNGEPAGDAGAQPAAQESSAT